MKHIFTSITRWLALITGVLMCLYFLNDSAFSAWMAGGPPSDHKLGWDLRAKESILQSCGSLLLGVAFFIGLRDLSKIGRNAKALLLIALIALLAPKINRAILVDQCLDGGGKWNRQVLECELK